MSLCLQCDCQVPLLLDSSAADTVADTYRGIDTFLTPHLLTRIRTYLGYIQMLAYNVTEDVQKVSDFYHLFSI